MGGSHYRIRTSRYWVAETTAERLAPFPDGTLFVTYYAHPRCNGATKATVRLAGLGRLAEEMIGGVTGWLDEGLRLVAGSAADAPILACGCGAAA